MREQFMRDYKNRAHQIPKRQRVKIRWILGVVLSLILLIAFWQGGYYENQVNIPTLKTQKIEKPDSSYEPEYLF